MRTYATDWISVLNNSFGRETKNQEAAAYSKEPGTQRDRAPRLPGRRFDFLVYPICQPSVN